MKIRISNNSIRLRLSQSEVTGFVDSGEVNTTCQFTNNILTYKVIHANYESISADFADDMIIVSVPSSLVRHWDTDERIGFDFTDKNGLYILIEKDFQCLKPRHHEDESGLYPNPQSNISSDD